MLDCPTCNSKNNGGIHNRKQKFLCENCGREFIENPTNKIISNETKELIEKHLLEKTPLAGIVRITGVSASWLQNHVNIKFENIPQKIIVTEKPKGPLRIECDEMWSFVGNKDNKQWIWLAKDCNTGEIVGVYVGSRDREGAERLWNSLPGVYRQCAVCYTDFWSAYETIIPSKRDRTVDKETGQTNHIENFNNIMRQRISRLVRKTLSFSKKIENHIGAIWNFIHYYNVSLAKC